MHYQQLLELAALVGLSRVALARHFGLSAVQVTKWATGTRPVPRKYRQELWEMIHDAAEAFLRSGAADVWPFPAPAGLAGLSRHYEAPPLRRLLEAQLEDVTLVHAEQRCQGLTAWIMSTCAALDELRRLAPAEIRKPATTARVHELAIRLVVFSEELARLAPRMDDAEEDDDGTETREPDGP